jgi:hypothetical protein
MANFLQFLRESIQPAPLHEDFYDVRVGGNSYEKKDELKKLGAKFDSMSKAWFIGLSKAPLVKKMGLTPLYPVTGSDTYGKKDVIKRAGGTWDLGKKRWYAPEESADALANADLVLQMHGGSDADRKELEKMGAFADHIELKTPVSGDPNHKYFTNYFRAQLKKLRVVSVGNNYMVPKANAAKAQKALDDFIADNKRIAELGRKLRRGAEVTGTYHSVPYEGVIDSGKMLDDHGFFAGLEMHVKISKPIVVYGHERPAGSVLTVSIVPNDLNGRNDDDTIELA